MRIKSDESNTTPGHNLWVMSADVLRRTCPNQTKFTGVKMQARLSNKGQTALCEGRTSVCLAHGSNDMIISMVSTNQPRGNDPALAHFGLTQHVRSSQGWDMFARGRITKDWELSQQQHKSRGHLDCKECPIRKLLCQIILHFEKLWHTRNQSKHGEDSPTPTQAQSMQ